MSTHEFLLHILARNITENKPTHDFYYTNVDHIITANLKSKSPTKNSTATYINPRANFPKAC